MTDRCLSDRQGTTTSRVLSVASNLLLLARGKANYKGVDVQHHGIMTTRSTHSMDSQMTIPSS